MPEQDPHNEGELRIGPFELVRRIGQGGFAEVWLARRKGPGGFEKRVAIKLVKVELRSDPMFEKMFLDEAKLAAAIHHPNVAAIYELGEIEGLLYLVMEYVPGRSLADLVNIMKRRGRTTPVGIVMRILAETCAGLHAAHELERDGKPLGVIHRDVSPQNVLVSDKGAVKLIDFGVAKANDRLSADTTQGIAKGKVRYMAPEQAFGAPLDRRADVWSVGSVAFDLLEGHPPYDGHNDLARLYKLMGATAPPEMHADVPRALKDVVRRALERTPDDRFATADEMRLAIEAALDASGLRVTDDDVAVFFREAFAAADDENDGPAADSAELRRRLARGSARAAMSTIDVPGPGDSAVHGDAPVETLSALDTSARHVPRPAFRRARIAAVVGVAVIGGGVLALGLRTPPPTTPTTEAPTLAAVPSLSVPAERSAPTEPALADASLPSPPPSIIELSATGDPVASSSIAPSKKPNAAPKPPRTRTPRIAPSSTSRPRYDDTIQ